MTNPRDDNLEAAVIVERVAAKLGCRTIALLGCARPAMIGALKGVDLVGSDAPEHTREAASLEPSGVWRPLAEMVAVVRDASAPFAVLSVAALQRLDDDAVASILAAVPAALVVDPDDVTGRGPAALRALVARLRERGMQCVHGELIAPPHGRTHRRCSAAVLVGDGHDDRARELVATGFHNLRLDPSVADESGATARVCIVSYEVVGPCRNGGIGTANTSLALALARAGHDVTLLFTGQPCAEAERNRWRQHFADRKVTYAELDDDRVAAVGSPHINVRRAWAAYEWVLESHERRPFDVIHAPECQGHLYFIAMAKRHGVAFANTELVTGVHSCTRWCAEANCEPMRTLASLADEHLERTATEASDAVVSPSGYMVSYLRDRGWQLPRRTFVQQYVTSAALRDERDRLSRNNGRSNKTPSELVFFGRLEVRKGIEAFCDALDGLAAQDAPAELSVTFLGSAVKVRGESSLRYVERRAANWPWPVQIFTDLSQPEAVDYLRSGDRLAVMPSLVDNSPNTVYEAVGLGIPCIVSRSGGTSELIAPEDLERGTFAGWPEDDVVDPIPAGAGPRAFGHDGLTRALRDALDHRVTPLARAIDADTNESVHAAWHAGLAARDRLEENESTPPRVSYVVPDDEDGPRGRAYQHAAKAATGDLLVIIGEGIEPVPEIDEFLARVAARSDADVFVFPVWDAEPAARLIVPIAGPPVLGLAYPFFEHSGFAIRSKALRAVNGFNESRAMAQPLVDVMHRAALLGQRIEVVPQSLGRRTTADPLRDLRSGDAWLDGVSWGTDPQQTLELLRPFQHARGLDDLPALFRTSQELVAEIVSTQRERHAEWERVYGELRAHADRVEAHADRVRAHAERVELSESRLRRRITDAERHRRDADARQRELLAALESYRSSRSWRLTAPLRFLARKLRSR